MNHTDTRKTQEIRAEAQRALELSLWATEGPWSYDVDEEEIHSDSMQDIGGDPVHIVLQLGLNKHLNSKFIVESRTLLPKLAEAVIRLCEEREKMMEALRFYADGKIGPIFDDESRTSFKIYEQYGPYSIGDKGTKARITLKEIGE